jgi:hypothetical protein
LNEAAGTYAATDVIAIIAAAPNRIGNTPSTGKSGIKLPARRFPQ